MGFGCHVGSPPWEQGFCGAILLSCGTRPVQDGMLRRAEIAGILIACPVGGPGGREVMQTPKTTQNCMPETDRASESPRFG